MLRIYFFCLVIMPGILLAQIPISEARSLPEGTVVTVNGIVTNGSEFGGIRYMQDPTGGIAVFPGTGSAAGFSPAPGSNITVTGTLKLFNGLLEIDPVGSFSVNSTGNPMPEPLLLTPSQIGEANESMLVRINDVTFNAPGAIITSTTWGFTSNGQSAEIFVRNSNPLIGTAWPFAAVDLIGIVSRFTASEPPVGGYQILPRGPADLVPASAINFTTAVQQIEIVPNGFTLTWSTDLAGTAGVNFGLDPSLGEQVISQNVTTDHAVVLEGLEPASFYYAQAWSVSGNDTVFSPIGYYSTASALPGWVRVYFNQAVDHAVATGPLAIDLGSAIDDTIRAYIERANTTIDVAVYNTSNNSIVNALNDAVVRGVQVRYVAEGSTTNSALVSLPEFPVHFRPNADGSGMHHKFIAIDADDPDSAFTLTGSMNFTNFSFFFDHNNLVVIKDQALTKAYRMEFEEMWGADGPLPDPQNSRFGADKLDDTPHLFNVNGTRIESRFSPSDGTTARINNALQSADHHIEFALFSLTNSTLTNALIEMHDQPGVTVRGILDDGEEGSSSMIQLLNAGVAVTLDHDDTALLHHKYAIVDRDMPDADPIVITGSHNWSNFAENYNDENTLFIHSAEVATQFYQEWSARWNTAVQIAEFSEVTAGFQLWPNPVSYELHMRSLSDMIDPISIQLTDATGRIILSGSKTATGSDPIMIDVRSLSPGAYMLIMEQNGSRSQRMFIRE